MIYFLSWVHSGGNDLFSFGFTFFFHRLLSIAFPGVPEVHISWAWGFFLFFFALLVVLLSSLHYRASAYGNF
jgi:hypothetical protein